MPSTLNPHLRSTVREAALRLHDDPECSGDEVRAAGLLAGILAEAGFEVGTRTIVDVLLSQQVLTSAQRDYSNARHNFLVNGLALKQAAGVIDVKDIAAVNRLLVRDAEAALAEFQND